MSNKPSSDYRQRFARVFDYIEQHLDGELSLDKLSTVACFSKYHFHRQFSAFAGTGVFQYVQLQRLKRAGYQLSFRDRYKVIDIALKAGFENAESFSRAFKKAFGQSPSAFRKQPDWTSWQNKYQALNNMELNAMQQAKQARYVNIVDFPETAIAALEHRGDPRGIMNSVRTFIQWRKRNNLGPTSSKTFNIFYDDPAQTLPRDYRMDICASTKAPVAPNPGGVVGKVIEGGRCAVLRHTGSDASLQQSVEWLYGTWLPKSNEQLRDCPLFVQRVNLFPDVKEHEMITDIYLPLR